MRLILPLFMCLLALPALAEKRAFVLANGAYENLSDLSNTHADADAYSGAFEQLGFAVTDHRDLTHFETLEAFDAFLNVVQPGDEVAFVFSGHGWSDGQTNFLVPTDSPTEGSERLLSRKTLALRNGYNGVLDELEALGAALTVAVIDACRDNPFKAPDGTRSFGLTRGLARVSAPQGTFVIFSAGEGQQALDRLPDDPPDQRLSVFSRVFVPHLTSGITLEDAISAAQAETARLALRYNGHRQHPAYYDQTLGETCLKGDCKPQLAAARPGSDVCDLMYEEAKSERACFAYEAYAKSCPQHVFNSFALGYIDRNCSAAPALPDAEVAALPPARAPVAAPEDPEKNALVLACDSAAVGPWHPDVRAERVAAPGVELADMDADAAVKACQSAVDRFPDHARSLSNLGRAMVAAEDTSALDTARRASEMGDAQAMNIVGFIYSQGLGVPRDHAAAVPWFRQASDLGHARAQLNLGGMYENGSGVPQDLTVAVQFYRAAAEQGYAAAQGYLGRVYLGGRGVAQDDSQAVDWFRAAANQGDTSAQVDLGWMYENGRGVAQDHDKAVELYRAAAARGDVRGQNSLGTMYFHGHGVPVDRTEAARWYRTAAARGHASAQTNLGTMYEHGHGVPQDHAQAVEWYRKAAAQGDMTAQANLGWMFDNGRGVAQDFAEARRWYQAAAEQGLARAQNNLGSIYHNGRGVAEDFAEALKWYRAAAEQGYASAQTNVGAMYEFGQGVGKDDVLAVEWYRKAADQGDARAQANMGWMYEFGRGVTQDYAEAVKWYRAAADQGNARAQTNLGSMYYNGQGVATDYAEAVKWYQASLDQGNSVASNNLGIMYAFGLGVPRDPSRAAQLYFDALTGGSDWVISRNSTDWDRDTARALQGLLKDAGVYTGPLDGSVGPGTQAAMRAIVARGG